MRTSKSSQGFICLSFAVYPLTTGWPTCQKNCCSCSALLPELAFLKAKEVQETLGGSLVHSPGMPLGSLRKAPGQKAEQDTSKALPYMQEEVEREATESHSSPQLCTAGSEYYGGSHEGPQARTFLSWGAPVRLRALSAALQLPPVHLSEAVLGRGS